MPTPAVAAGGVRLLVRPDVVFGALVCVPFVVATALAFWSGGYFITEWGVAAIIVLALLALVRAFAPVSFGGRLGAVALAGWGGLALWQGISAQWAAEPHLAYEAMNLTLFYGACFALALVCTRRPAHLTVALHAALVGSVVVCGYALGSRLLPDLIGGDGEPRLSNPITYWNGLGIIAAFGVALAVGLAARRAGPWWLRMAAGATAPLLLTTLLLTYSRGAILSLVVGLLVMLAIVPGRIETAASMVATVGVSVPLLGWMNGNDRLAAISGQLPEHADAGQTGLMLVVLTMLAAAAATGLGAWAVARLPERRRRVTGVALGSVAAAAVIVALAVNWPSQGPVGWAQDQFASFKSFNTTARVEAESVQDRIAVAAGSGRWQNWSVAAEQFTSSPITGTGAGDYRFEWAQNRDVDLYVLNAHSLYLEVLGELGLVGLVLLLVPAGAALVAFVVMRGHVPGSSRAADGALAITAAVVVAAHAGGDWDWQLPATVLGAAALAGALIGAAADATPAGRAEGPSAWIGAGAGLAAVVLAVGTIAPMVAAQYAENDARRTAAAGAPAEALAHAATASSLAPADPGPRLVRAYVLSSLDDGAGADAAFAAALAQSPSDSAIYADWAADLLGRGEPVLARALAQRARVLNPLERRTSQLAEAAGVGGGR